MIKTRSSNRISSNARDLSKSAGAYCQIILLTLEFITIILKKIGIFSGGFFSPQLVGAMNASRGEMCG